MDSSTFNSRAINVAMCYLSLGFSVFPVHTVDSNGACSCNNIDCKSAGKHPKLINGVNGATNDPSVVNSWWNGAYRGSGVAIATGRKSGFFVVDVDKKHHGLLAWENFKDDHQLDDYETPLQKTPSGGSHVFYAMPEKGKVKTATNVIANGIDVRGDGGYIVAYPSTGYEYELDQSPFDIEIQQAPQAILDLVIKKDKEKIVLTPSRFTELTYPPIEVEKILSALNFINNYDDYSTWFKIGAALHDSKDKRAFEWWCNWSKQSDKYDIASQEKTWQEFNTRQGKLTSKVTLEYLYKLASENNWHFISEHKPITFNSEHKTLLPQKSYATLQLNGREDLINSLPSVPDELPSLTGKISNFITATSRRPQPELAKLTALQIMAFCGRKIKSLEGVKLNLITIGIALSAAGKEHGQSLCLKLLNQVGLSKYCFGNIASHLDIINNLLDASAQNLYIIDEIHGLFNAIKSKNAASYESKIMPEVLKLNTGDGYQLRGNDIRTNLKTIIKAINDIEIKLEKMDLNTSENKRLESKLKSNLQRYKTQRAWLEQNYIPSPYFALMGHSTPQKIDEIICRDQIEQGFVGRALFARGDELRPTKNNTVSTSFSLEELANDLKQLCNIDKHITATKEAKILLSRIDHFFEANINEPVFGAVIARGYEQLLKLCSILSMPNCVVTPEIVSHAFKLVLNSFDSISYIEKKNAACSEETLLEDRLDGIHAYMFKLAKNGIYQSQLKQSVLRSNAWLKKRVIRHQSTNDTSICPYEYILQCALDSGLLTRKNKKIFVNNNIND